MYLQENLESTIQQIRAKLRAYLQYCRILDSLNVSAPTGIMYYIWLKQIKLFINRLKIFLNLIFDLIWNDFSFAESHPISRLMSPTILKVKILIPSVSNLKKLGAIIHSFKSKKWV